MIFEVFIFFMCLDGLFCDDIFGCGGFVKSNFVINYSRVEIKLYTKQGSLKYQTDCAPNNGYYLIPLYDKGDYLLKIEPPNGWSFEPKSVSLLVDGTSDPCSLNQDINFMFKGFTLSGQILSFNQNDGPSEIKVVLKQLNGDILKTTKSNDGGHYSFSEVLPGSYVIEASHEKWHFLSSTEPVTVAQDNVKTNNKIVLAGFDVHGYVFSEGESIPGVNFLLFSDVKHNLDNFISCDSKPVKSFNYMQQKKNYLCHVTSLKDGSFTFPSVPTGDYTLVPFYKGEHIEFDVSPSQVDFTVTYGTYEFLNVFKVEGFSVSGRILESVNGKGLQGAEIFINDKRHTVTEERGVYHLENMRAGSYQVEVKMPHVFFDIVTLKVTPNSPHLPDIYASRFSLCGKVQIDQYPLGLQENERVVFLKSLDRDFHVNMNVNSDRIFCAEVPPGKYEIEPVVSKDESSHGLKFVPKKKTVQISHFPVLDISFKQFRAVIKGQVDCILKCKDLVLDLVSVSGNSLQMKAGTNDDGMFQFEGCLPGNYILTVVKNDWCFDNIAIAFTVSNYDETELKFKQTGFNVRIILTHATSFKLKYPSGESHIELKNTTSVICLPEAGIYEFTPVGCHLYEKEKYLFDTNNPTEIKLRPIKHLVAGNVITELNVTDIKVFIEQSDNSNKEEILLSDPVLVNKTLFKYSFSLYVKPYTDLQIKLTSAHLLLRPHVSHVKVLNDCILDALSITGKKGLFINGSIVPALENVKLLVLDKKTNARQAIVHSDKLGKYIVGPLDSDNEYIVKAEKEGYVLTQKDALGNFLAYKLAEVTVDVKAENGAPLPGVLLSLSGGVDYRKNSVTQKDGKMSFLGLSPGQYFLRPMLKEYRFQPSTKMIDIKEGTQVNVKISGKRVAFSLFGVINSLTGEPEVGVAVEAIGVGNDTCNQYQEEAISEQDGSFRIRGLHPNCQYSIHLKDGADNNQHIERVTPEEIIVKIETQDIKNVRLIAFRYFGQMDVSGRVITNQEYLHSLKVRLFSEDNPDQIIYTASLAQSAFFYLPSMAIDNKTYVLRLDSSLPSSSFQFDSPSITFCANKTFYHFTLSFHPRMKSVDQEVTQGSYLALPLSILLVLLAYNYSTVLEFIVQFCGTVSPFVNPVRLPIPDTAPSETVKKKVKPRKA